MIVLEQGWNFICLVYGLVVVIRWTQSNDSTDGRRRLLVRQGTKKTKVCWPVCAWPVWDKRRTSHTTLLHGLQQGLDGFCQVMVWYLLAGLQGQAAKFQCLAHKQTEANTAVKLWGE